MKKISFLFIPVMILTGCASHLSQQQCLTTNWYNLGQADGVSGHLPQDLQPAMKDCAQYKISVDTAGYINGWRAGTLQYCSPTFNDGYQAGVAGQAITDVNGRLPICNQAGHALKVAKYRSGWRKGVESFCTYDNGMNYARQGKYLPDICPPDLLTNFGAGWRAGQSQFCGDSANAFALARAGKQYPGICPPDLFVAFRGEYDRGVTLKRAVDNEKATISRFNDDIRDRSNHYNLRENAYGEYEIGSDNSPEAQTALAQVNQMVREKRSLERDSLALQVTR